MSGGSDRAAFIRRNTRILTVPLVPEIRLHTADDATALWEKTEAELAALHLPPPFWAFPWAGGQALARHVLDHPEAVRGRRVLDFASGSGLVAVAAMHAGAERAEAADIDAIASVAADLNAALNGVALETRRDDLVGTDEGWDVVLAADIFYERDTARAATTWLATLARRGALVLVADPGRAYFDATGSARLATYAVPVTRAIEDADMKSVGVWQVLAN